MVHHKKYGGSVTIASGDGSPDGGNIDIITDGDVVSGDINLRTGNADTPGHINLNTAYGNADLGSITLSTGQEYQPANSWWGNITLVTSWLGNIDLLSATNIQLKTLGGEYGSNIMIGTGNSYDGANNIYLTVGDGGGGIFLNPNAGLVEIIGSGTYTGTWTQASDERYKSKIKPLLGIGYKVNLLRPVEYEWSKEEFPENNFPDGNQIGLIAQEVEKLFPEIVATNKDGYKSIDYSKISVLLIQAVREQQNEIDKMKNDIEELKSMIMRNSNDISSNVNQQEVN